MAAIGGASGSLNSDRVWDLTYGNNVHSGLREQAMREKWEPEPICCPNCAAIRQSGPKCPRCGFVATKKSRMVVQVDGTLKPMHGDIFKARPVSKRDDTERLWQRMYYRMKSSGHTFTQAEALFFVENRYYPPRDLPLMPLSDVDWFKKVEDVPRERLREPQFEVQQTFA